MYIKSKRDEKITVTCSINTTEKCRGTYNIARRARDQNLERNGKMVCLFCSRFLKSGENNPNCKYKYDRNLFEKIDTEDKAYLLGWIASDGHVAEGEIVIAINERDLYTLIRLKDIVCSEIPICSYEENKVSFRICSKKMVKDVCALLGIRPGKKFNTVAFTELEDVQLQWAYIRGLFDGDGWVRSPYKRNGLHTVVSG